MKRLFLCLSILILPLTTLFAADATGKWKGSFEVPGGTVLNLTFNLKAAAGALSGTVAGLPPKQDGLEIKEGKVDGNTVSFFIMTEYQGNPIKVVYTGKVGDGEIKFTMGTDDGSWSTEILAKPTE